MALRARKLNPRFRAEGSMASGVLDLKVAFAFLFYEGLLGLLGFLSKYRASVS